MMEGGGLFLTGERRPGRDSRDSVRKSNLEADGGTPSIPSISTLPPVLPAQSMNTLQTGGTGGDAALREPV
jgi:hypothetical protein